MSVSFQLSEEQQALQALAHEFARDVIRPAAPHHDETGEYAHDVLRQAHELGLMNTHIGEAQGGLGLGALDGILMAEELAWGCTGIGTAMEANGLAQQPVILGASEELKDKYLAPMVDEYSLCAYAVTEPGAGSDVQALKTTAVKQGDTYILNGNKMWITNGCVADVAVVWAKLDGVVRGFIVEKGTPGFSTTLQQGKFSLRASVTSELHFQDCRIPKGNLLPDVQGLKGPLSCLTQARYGIAWGAVGSAMACFDCARKYTGSRIQFDKPIASFQIVQAKLAEQLSEITKAQLVALRLGQMKEAGTMTPQHVSLAKRNNVRIALDIARICRDMLGANGVTHEYPVGRHMLNLESVITYEGTHDIHTLILGQSVTGIAAYS